MREYLLTAVVSAAVTYLLTPVARRIALRWGAMTPVRDRDVHAIPTPRLGGVAMMGGFTAALVVGCLGAAAGLPIRRPPELLDNQAVPASTVILAPTASTPATSQASATTSSTTTVADAAATPEASQLPTTSGQVISSGQRIVPALAGLHRKQVADVLAQAQLGVQMIPIHVSDSRQVQQVVGQRPSAGHILQAGSAVTVPTR